MSYKGILLCLATMLYIPGQGRSQEYDFEIPEIEERNLEFSGNLDAKWGLLGSRKDSPFYPLQNLPATTDDYLSQYRLDFYLDGEYRFEELGVFVKSFSQYVRQEPIDPSLFELYGSLNLSPRLSMSLGKRRYNWGKGYAFNPVGYINAQKDPENPDLALAGLSALSLDFNRSLEGHNLQNFSLSGVVLIPEAEDNTRFAPASQIGMALKFYLLVRDVDIELMTLYRRGQARRYGADFAANLKTNLEMHGELDYAVDEDTYRILNGDPVHRRRSGLSYLLGIRYLTATNTTLVAEFYHRSNGMNKAEFVDYVAYVQDGAKDDLSPDAEVNRAIANDLFRSKNLMRDYAYAKLTHPEPFSLLYSSVAAFVIYNLQDESFVLSPQFAFKPFTNFEFLCWPSLLAGGAEAEYGSRTFQRRIEFWMRFFF
jgi:hypothetical protein